MMVQLASSALLLPHSRENGRCRRRGSRRKVDPPRAELSQRSPPGASSSSARALSASGTAEAQTQQATASGCPYTAAKSAAKSAFAAVSGAVHQLGGGAERPGAGAEYTGPSNPLEHARTLFTIATLGMERATLAFLQTYGPICRFPNFGLSSAKGWTFVYEPSLVEWVCATNSKNYEHRFLPDVYAFVTGGSGILASQGATNRKHRRICQPPFASPKSVQGFADTICRQADRLASAWDAALAARGGAPLRADVATDMQRLTLDIVGAVAFSHDFRQVDLVRTTHLRGCAAPADAAASNAPAPSDRLLENINAAQEVMGRLFVTPAPLLRAFRALRLPFMVAMDAAFEEMRLSMAGVIARRREAVARGERSGDLLDALLLAEDPVTGQRLSDHELWEDVHDVMGAGHETTASTLTACLYSLSQHPHVQRRLQEELDVALQGAPPTWEAAQSGRLWYAEAVVKEALRLYPPIALFPRVAERADVLPSGHAVEAGEVVFMSAYAMGRSEATWGPTVLQFDPLRFAREAEARRHRFAYLPFGAGPRACMGGSFALMSTTLVLARLAQRYSFRSLEPRGEIFPTQYDITLNFPGGVPMEITLRADGPEESASIQAVADDDAAAP